MNLIEMSLKYDTDKNPNGHNYVKVYENYFSLIRESVKNLLEIGTWKGASAQLFYEYFSNANIHTLDCGLTPGQDIQKTKKEIENDRIKLYIGDQSNISLLEENFSNIKLDLVIDDGSHRAPDQLISFETLLPFMNQNSLYIIEDIHTAYWPGWGGADFIDHIKNMIDEVNFDGGYRQNGNKSSNSDFLIENKLYKNIYQERIKSIHFYTGLIIILIR